MASKDLVKAIKQFGKDFEKNLKINAPYRTGRLKKSIKSSVERTGETIKAGVEMVYYGQYVNDGTYKMAAQPFINDSWAETRFNSDVDEAILDEIEEMFDITFNK
jgi:HK97 gp10 family phage protein